jgi:hypothetical protein
MNRYRRRTTTIRVIGHGKPTEPTSASNVPKAPLLIPRCGLNLPSPCMDNQRWNVKESTIIQEFPDEGKAEGEVIGEVKAKAASILRLLEIRFPPGAPADLADAIRRETDLNRLNAWFDVAATTSSLSDFRHRVGL